MKHVMTLFITMMVSSTTAFVINKSAGQVCGENQSQINPSLHRLRESSVDSFDQTPESEESVTSTDSTPGIDKAWRHVSKPLLRIGSKGLAPSHARSLDELMKAHTCVKIKINTRKFGSLVEVFGSIQELVQQNTSTKAIELIHVRNSDNVIMVGPEGALDMIRAGEFPPPPPPENEDDEDEDDN